MKVIALTGGVASGKSTVLKMFMRLGAFGIDCDVLSREALRPCTSAWWSVVKAFGKDILRRDLEIKREKLREIVFSDEEKRRTLERIVHPEVRRMLKERLNAIKTLTAGERGVLVVVDVPLLFELGMQSEFERVIVVYASEAVRLRRLLQRGFSREIAMKIMRAQMPLEEKAKQADFVIYNEDSKEETEKEVRKIFETLMAEANLHSTER
ncbi:MAG: dephospho-CoA kinase [Candidatus Methanospirare jalkutatii]|nr:dephospho-CoA kinase [Candidatus Methanospirare jalkutatii]